MPKKKDDVNGLRHLATLEGHNDAICDLSWSPDGLSLATASYDKKVILWDTVTFARKSVFQKHTDWVYALAWSPDGKAIASGSADGSIRIWTAAEQNVTRTIKGMNCFTAVAWSRCGSRIASGSGYDLLDDDEPLRTTTQEIAVESDFPLLRPIAFDETTIIWDAKTGNQIHRLAGGHQDGVKCIQWSPDGVSFATGGLDRRICIWDTNTGSLVQTLNGHGGHVNSVCWSSDGRLLYSGSDDKSIRVWRLSTGLTTQVLEEHTAPVDGITVSFDGTLIASRDSEFGIEKHAKVKLWCTRTYQALAEIPFSSSKGWRNGIAFHPRKPILATLDSLERAVHIWQYDQSSLLKRVTPTNSFTSAKIVIVGESNSGKTCLTTRLTEDRYPAEWEHGTTHGMQFRKIDANQFRSRRKSKNRPSKREIVFWDMGGQDEYRLVHQLFLHDTNLALIVFDPTRGRVSLEEANDWNTRLDRQLGNRSAAKFLVGSKLDTQSNLVNAEAISDFVLTNGLKGYCETSARTGRGIELLRQKLINAIDWRSVARTRRPKIFQIIRDEIFSRKSSGSTVVLASELRQEISKKSLPDFSDSVFDAVVSQLAIQGLLVETTLASEEKLLVLDVAVIERYAGALLIAARDSITGVSALEERLVAELKISLPGITHRERLPRTQERLVLESVVQLLVHHGICFRHQGLLIFPSLFKIDFRDQPTDSTETAILYYDFSGAVDNVYASLIAWLVLGKSFGQVRLWRNRAEFSSVDGGGCGIQRIDKGRGYAQLEVYFGRTTDRRTRDLFASFVEDHLYRHDIHVVERCLVRCTECDYELPEEIVQSRFQLGKRDVGFPKCDKRLELVQGVGRAKQMDHNLKKCTYALRYQIDEDLAEAQQGIRKTFDRASLASTGTKMEDIKILHLSDLHFSSSTQVEVLYQAIEDDLASGLGVSSIDILVISGDFTDKGCPQGFDKAREFVSSLMARFKLSAAKCVFAPGNHDVQDLDESYRYASNIKGVDSWKCVRKEDIHLVQDEQVYSKRFQSFSDLFYHKIIQKPYPSVAEEQYSSQLFLQEKIQFISLNSAWRIDQFFRKRSGISETATARAIRSANEQITLAKKSGDLSDITGILRIGVWHHSVSGPDAMRELNFLEHLRKNGVKICLHGDVHELNRDCSKFWSNERLWILGGGSFGASVDARPEGSPRLYQLIRVDRSLSRARVHTRYQDKPGGAWSGWNAWPNPDSSESYVSWFDIQWNY